MKGVPPATGTCLSAPSDVNAIDRPSGENVGFMRAVAPLGTISVPSDSDMDRTYSPADVAYAMSIIVGEIALKPGLVPLKLPPGKTGATEKRITGGEVGHVTSHIDTPTRTAAAMVATAPGLFNSAAPRRRRSDRGSFRHGQGPVLERALQRQAHVADVTHALFRVLPRHTRSA